jgi:RhtB (resistance to homoserine/threonine) family protein
MEPSQIWHEFFIVAGLHALAVASPGPDFAIVVKQSVSHGRKVGVVTAWGVGTGILIHVTYSLLGIGLIIRNSETLFMVLKWLAGGYLFYLGWQALRATPGQEQALEILVEQQQGSMKAFRTGFLTNGLNPKATLFFVALFTAVISPHTPWWAQALYGVYMALATALWFTLVATVFSNKRVRNGFERLGHWFDRLMGLALIGLAVKLFTAQLDS